MAIPSTRTAAVLAKIAGLLDRCERAGYVMAGIREIDYGRQVQISDGKKLINVNIYGGKKGISVVVAGDPSRPLHAAVARIVAGLGSAAPEATIHETDGPASEPARVPGTVVGPASVKENETRADVTATETGGRQASATAATDRLASRNAPARSPASGKKRPAGVPPGPWIGSDESGKGDYFGPLVAAAVYVVPEQEAALRAAGVRDSKLLDDGAARRVAAEIRQLCAGHYAEEVLAPAEYNELYAQFKAGGENLNHLLAWGHVHVLDALLAGGALLAEPAPTVIADQFANERYVRERLQQAMRNRGLPMPALLQMHRAEANVAVAAASILARDRFLGWLADASARYGFDLPKGGSKPSIIAAARRIVERLGRAELAQAAKLHFATTRSVPGAGG